MRILGKEVLTSKRDVEGEITARVRRALETFNARPSGILVGPNEWVHICHEFKKRTGSKKDPADASVYYHGLPVFVKTTPGVDVIIPAEQAGRFAIGEMKREEGDQNET